MERRTIDPATMLIGIVAGVVIGLLWPRAWKQPQPPT